MTKELGAEKTKALMPYYTGALQTEKDATRVLDTIWPDAPKEEKVKAALLCVHYQLNPLMKHLFLIKFGNNWNTVLGIQASRLIAHRAGDFSYIDNTPRVMTKAEQEAIFGEVLDDRICAITKLRDSHGMEAQGYGTWQKKENPYGTEKGNTKANMAFIRSERQAMDRLFAGKLPAEQDVVDERYVPMENGREVDVTTGEIQELKVDEAERPFTKEEMDLLESRSPASPEATEPKIEPVEESTGHFTPAGLDLEWLDEQLKILQGKGLKSWTNANVLLYLNAITKQKATTVPEAAGNLDKDQTTIFVRKINEAVEMS